MAAVSSRPGAQILDLCGYVESNFALFGRRLGCRVHALDLVVELERHRASGSGKAVSEAIDGWFEQPDRSVDGALCWDVFDYLDLPTASMVARHLTRLIAPNGVAFAMFRTSQPATADYGKDVAEEGGRLVRQASARQQPEGAVLQNREIIHLFEGLRVTDSFLLRNNTREILFCRPDYLASASPRR